MCAQPGGSWGNSPTSGLESKLTGSQGRVGDGDADAVPVPGEGRKEGLGANPERPAQSSALPLLFQGWDWTLDRFPLPRPPLFSQPRSSGRSSRNPHLIRSQPASSTPWAPLCPWDEAQAPRSPGHRSFPCPLGPLKSPRSASSLLALSRAQVAPPTAGRTAGTLLALPSAGAFPPELPWCSLLYRRDRSGPGSVRGQRPWGGTGRAPELRVPSRGPRSRP